MKNFLRFLVLTISILIVSVPVFASDLLTTSYDTMLIKENYDNYFGYDTSIANVLDLNSIKVQTNGKFINFTDSNGNKVEPQIINDRTMVPMRKIFEEFGAEVDWIPETRSIIAKTDEKEIGLQIDNVNAIVKNINGEIKNISLDSVPVIVDDRTLVPVRFVAESLDKIVGWDIENKAVVIVDPEFIEEEIKEKASTLYEYLTTDFETVTTSVTQSDITGKVKYEDKDTNISSTLNITGDAQISLAGTAVKMDLDLNVTGKGVLITTVKEEGLEKIDATIIIDAENGFMYISSNLLGEDMDGKWARYEFKDSDKKLLQSSLTQNNGMEGLVDSLVNEEGLVLGSYEELKNTVNIITSLMGNDNFKSSGRTTKTYKIEIDLEKILEAFGYTEEEIKEIDDVYDFEMTSEIKVADKVAKKSNTTLDFKMDYEDEALDVNLVIDSSLESYNEKVNIEMPTNYIVAE